MIITRFPNNEVRVRIPPPPAKRKKRNSPRPRVAVPLNLSIVAELRRFFPEAFAPEKKDDKIRVGYGKPGRPSELGIRARRQIVRAGSLLGDDVQRSNVVFLTSTLPGSTLDALMAIAAWSSWAVHELLTVIPRILRTPASELRWIWVWEHQKRGALHWHCAIACPDYLSSLRLRSKFRDLWVRILRTIGEKSGTDIAARADGGTWKDNPELWRVEAAPARKNPSRYLAKYLSKGSRALSSAFFPPRWYGGSRNLIRLLGKNIVRFCTSSVTQKPDWFLADSDCDFLAKMTELSSHFVSFSDVVKTGYTFVFYPSEKSLCTGDFRRIFGSLFFEVKKQEVPVVVNPDSLLVRYPYLTEISKHPRELERLRADVGTYSCVFLDDFLLGGYPPPDELFWLDRVSYKILLYAGLVSRVNPPPSDEGGLTGQNAPIMESLLPPNPYGVQISLLP